MKKILLLVVACATLAAHAQTEKELANFKKQLEKSDASVADPKKANSQSTWINRASDMISLSNIYTSYLAAGLPIEQNIMMIGEDPDEIVEVNINGQVYKKYEYENFDIYVNENGETSFWQAKKEFVPGALEKAFDALTKAQAINPKGYESAAYFPSTNLYNAFNTEAMNYYNLGNKEQAAATFEKMIKVKALSDDVDSVMIYYTGVSYLEAKNDAKAMEYLNKALEIGYDENGSVYYYVAYMLEQQSKPDEAIALLKKGLAKYPDNEMLNTELLGLYITTKKSPEEIAPLLKKAQALDPENPSNFITEGILWTQMGDFEKAKASFLKAGELDPESPTPFMNVGFMEADQGDKIVKQANDLDVNDVAGYNKLVEEAVPHYTEAIEMLEKAHEIDPRNEDVILTLRQLYYPRREESVKNGERYEYFNKLYKQFEQE